MLRIELSVFSFHATGHIVQGYRSKLYNQQTSLSYQQRANWLFLIKNFQFGKGKRQRRKTYWINLRTKLTIKFFKTKASSAFGELLN